MGAQYTVRVDSISGPPGSTHTVDVVIDSTAPWSSFALSVCHDVTHANALVTWILPPADNWFVSIANANGAHVDLVAFDLGSSLGPGSHAVARIIYLLNGPVGSQSSLSLCMSPGVPQSLVGPQGAEVVPMEVAGTLHIHSAAGVQFQRGDCNGDGAVNVADIVRSLDGVFGPAAPLDCESACDTNDDGQIDISDPVRLVSVLFGNGATPLPSPTACGHDSSPDLLSCVASPCP